MKPRAAAWLIIPALTFAIPLYAGMLHAESTACDAVAAMRARYGTIRDELRDNQFGQPIYLTSEITDKPISGELSGLIEHPFEYVASAFKSAHNWCDIMMLHPNIKYCRASENGADHILTVFVGTKYHQPLESAYRGEYRYRVLDHRQDYFKVALTSDSGPFKNNGCRILLEAVPANHGRTFIHFTFSYEFSALVRTAQSVYFHTVGHNKVGFTVVDKCPDGRPIHVGGIRGALERNIMRYYLAIKAYLDALSVPPNKRLEKRLKDWFALTERYPLQLRELDKNKYMSMKRQEYERLGNE